MIARLARSASASSGGRRRRVDVRTRRLHQRLDDGRMRGDERAGDARRLAERAHDDDALGGKAEMRERSAPLAQHAEAMRIVDDQPRVELLGQREQRRQRREVAVHAEHRIGRDQLARRAVDAASRARSAATSPCAIADESARDSSAPSLRQA